MFSRVRIAIRFFFVGLAVGVLLAPRSGEETRRLVREKADRLLNDILDAATLGTTYESRAAESTPQRRGRGGNGRRSRGSTRTSATTSEGEGEGEPTAASEAGV